MQALERTRLARRDRTVLRLEHEGNKRLRPLGNALYRLGVAPRNRDVLLLTTRGRRSGHEHTVLLQFFREGTNMVVVAANSGRAIHPDWYQNLMARPTARVEMKNCTLPVHAEELSDDEAAALWPRILRHAPSYVRYRQATSRTIPLIRLVPTPPTRSIAASWPSAKVSRTARREAQEIAPDVYCLRTGRWLTDSNVYFVRSGSSWVLIDTARPWCGALIKKNAEVVFGANTHPTAILLTHDHFDHAGSAIELARTWGC